MNNLFKNIYTDPSNPGAFGGIRNLYIQAKKVDPNITLKNVKDWLKRQHTYTLHRPARRRWKRNRIYVSYIDEQWEIDLIDLQIYSVQNDGYKYLLMIIDVFSKYLFAFPTKTKTALEILNIFKNLFKNRKPTKIRSDRGGEFDNRIFRDFCKRNNVIYFTTENKDIKCSVVERVNRTFKDIMFRYFTQNATRKYVDVLPKLLNNYNNRPHSSIKMAPSEVDIEDEPTVYFNLYGKDNKHPMQPKLKSGDDVRLRYELSPFDKSYYPLWTDRVYKISKAFEKFNKPLYTLHDGEQELKRRFYPEELQQVSIDKDTLWLIDRIVDYRTVRGRREALIKWKGYPESFNQWIPVTEIKHLTKA